MAKRIIKYGKYNVITCPDCVCELAFDKTDIIIESGKVLCPQCEAECTPTIKANK